MRKRILASLTILSSVLLLATVGLWIRSYWRMDDLTLIRPTYTLSVSSSAGGVYFMHDGNYLGMDDSIEFDTSAGVVRLEEQFEPFGSRPRRWQGVQFSGTADIHLVIVSHWVPVALFAMPPLIWLWRRKSIRPGGFPVGSPSSPAKPDAPSGTDGGLRG